MHPNQFTVNEAWLVFKLNDEPIHTGSSSFRVGKLSFGNVTRRGHRRVAAVEIGPNLPPEPGQTHGAGRFPPPQPCYYFHSCPDLATRNDEEALSLGATRVLLLLSWLVAVRLFAYAYVPNATALFYNHVVRSHRSVFSN